MATIRKMILHPCMAGAVVAVFCLLAGDVHAQNTSAQPDTSPPVIGLEELEQTIAGRSQVFTVQISEDTELSEATLFYRRAGEQDYIAEAMRPLGDSGFYTTSIPTDPADTRSLEYYVLASDAAGNRTFSGFAFDPYERILIPAAPAGDAITAENGSTSPAEQAVDASGESILRNRWVQIALGVVAVGIIANAMDSGDGEDIRRVPVRITLE